MNVIKNIFGFIWKNVGVRIWVLVTIGVMVVLITASALAINFEPLRNVLFNVFGEPRQELVSGDPTQFTRFKADYENKEKTLAAANKLNEQLAAEGIILLKNDNDALPMSGSGKNVSVFGKNSVNLVYGGSGSSGTGTAEGASTIYSSLTAAGFTYNTTLKSFYDNNNQSGRGRPDNPDMTDILTGFPTGETPILSYTNDVKSSYTNYKDAALVVISRIGGEGFDLPRTMTWNGSNYISWEDTQTLIPDAGATDDHYLQLDQNEKDLLAHVSAEFDKVVLIVNCNPAFELGFLDDGTYDIDAALWIGSLGKSGVNVIGDILSGEINPSGHTVDTFARNFKNDPSWNNFGNNRTYNGNRYTGNADVETYFVEYEEGIYVGYRYYETRGASGAVGGEGESWYKENVVFPFGHGLSYSDFSWSIVGNSMPASGSTLTENGTISVTVRVTNNSDRAGKDVVQLYYTAPYTPNGIEKSHVVLGAFKKTELIPAHGFADVPLTLNVSDLKSYDYSDANSNGFKGYEVEAGTYKIKLSKDAHDSGLELSFTVPTGGFLYDEDGKTGYEVKNRFDDVSGHIQKYLTRSNWNGTWPTIPTTEDRAQNSAFFASLEWTLNDKPTDPWYTTQMPRLATSKLGAGEATVQLYELFGKSYDDPLWDELIKQITLQEMVDMIGSGAYNTMQIEGIGKPRTTDPDGPPGFVLFMSVGGGAVYDTCMYVSECVIAASWNRELAFKMGEMIGNEGLIGNEKRDSRPNSDGRPYSGWYAPAMNIHRSQFGGRNWEYYSEDGYLSGAIGAEVVKGAKSKGVYTYLKHFALNDQETTRDINGLVTWASEQSMREIYLKPFEICVKEGGSQAVMSSFNRIGTVWAGGSYQLLTEVLRNEWGFVGMVITDFNVSKKYMSPDLMIRAGGDLNLTNSYKPTNTTSMRTATQVSAICKATKNILYTVANSNAMNGRGEGVVYRYLEPLWIEMVIWINIGVGIAFAIWGSLIIFFTIRKKSSNII